MKKIVMKYGSFVAAFALLVTTLIENSTCVWITYQEPLPDSAKQLRKF